MKLIEHKGTVRLQPTTKADRRWMRTAVSGLFGDTPATELARSLLNIPKHEIRRRQWLPTTER